MAYLESKLTLLKSALSVFGEALELPYSTIVRDAAIQRYEFTFELLWKSIKIYLQEHEGIEGNSPKSCFREIKAIFELTDEEIELCLQMCEDRNLSVHTYSEKLAKALYDRLKSYLEISRKIFEKMAKTAK